MLQPNSLGKALGEGGDPQALMADRRTVAEGAHTAPVLGDLASRMGGLLPFRRGLARIVKGRATVTANADDIINNPDVRRLYLGESFTL